MPYNAAAPLEKMIEKLAMRSSLLDGDRAALISLPHSIASYDPGSYIIRDGDIAVRCIVLISGFAFRHKITRHGGRQIVSIHMPGDIINLNNIHIGLSDYNVQAVTSCTAVTIPVKDLQELLIDNSAISAAFFTISLVEASSYREWMLNLGRRDARGRVSHLLCEFAVKLDTLGIGPGQSYDLPMTQEQIGDAVGLSAVHVSRTLKSLAQDGLITMNKRGIGLPNWNRLKDEAGFNARYLHISE
ncbi:Crp/Fnr family transcriptional regulator [Sphingomonas albertensis]|uniref:Crp/Fnr family transcriptional regulator n=1 Tax=Sphingomonas albertensis TaxID=2762591 RepID=A0ABR7AKF9_9SPHN|nr:Crp/Fnr family transcriptional regulator [Sphingomonas albertensis]MBC3940945.1 Crp/Fnr family transcriptional regulator [Sphingomonas albertensis]